MRKNIFAEKKTLITCIEVLFFYDASLLYSNERPSAHELLGHGFVKQVPPSFSFFIYLLIAQQNHWFIGTVLSVKLSRSFDNYFYLV